MITDSSIVGLKPVGDRILVYIYDDGETTVDLGDGVHLVTSINDTMLDSAHNNIDGKHPGARGRWALVVGVNEHTPDSIKVGAKVFLDEMKWSRGFMAGPTGERCWNIPYEDVLLVDEAGFIGDHDAEPLVTKYIAAFNPDQIGAAE